MFQADTSEPAEIIRPLTMSFPDLEHLDLNKDGYPDYVYDGCACFCHGFYEFGYERKTWNDIVSNSEEVEAQLRRQVQKHPNMHHGLIIEGLIEPSASGVYLYHKRPGKNEFYSGLKDDRRVRPQRLLAWELEVRKYMDVIHTSSMAMTVYMLACLYNAAQDEDGWEGGDRPDSHTTFRRYFKPMKWHPNPQVERLLGSTISGDNLAQARVELIIAKFGTMWRAVKASPEEWAQIPGIGVETARKYLRSIGRGDV